MCGVRQRGVIKDYIPDQDELSKIVKTQWKQEKADNKGEFGKNALEPFREWAKEEMREWATAGEKKVEAFATGFWIQKIDEYKTSCVKIVKGSAALTEDEKTILERYILEIRPPKFKTVDFSLNQDVAGERSFLFFSWAHVNPKRCASDMREKISSRFTTFNERYLTSLKEDITTWANVFIQGLKQELVTLNPTLAELDLKIQAYTDQIEKLEQTHKRLEEAQKELNSYFTFKEGGGTK